MGVVIVIPGVWGILETDLRTGAPIAVDGDRGRKDQAGTRRVSLERIYKDLGAASVHVVGQNRSPICRRWDHGAKVDNAVNPFHGLANIGDIAEISP